MSTCSITDQGASFETNEVRTDLPYRTANTGEHWFANIPIEGLFVQSGYYIPKTWIDFRIYNAGQSISEPNPVDVVRFIKRINSVSFTVTAPGPQ